MDEDGDTLILHWVPERNDWEKIAWNVWLAFMAILDQPKGLPNISGGIHYFMAVIAEGDTLYNLIPHKYLIGLDGKSERSNFAGWTKEDRAEYSRLMVEMNPTKADGERLYELRRKGEDEYLPPRQSLVPLIRCLAAVPKEGSAAERHLDEMMLKSVRTS
jgi:hypothetical protein